MFSFDDSLIHVKGDLNNWKLLVFCLRAKTATFILVRQII
jgi:hypothetical protein